MSPSLLLHALRTQLSMLLTLFKEVNTPAVMSLSNDTLWDVFPAIQITVDRGSSSKDRTYENFCQILNRRSQTFF